MMNENWYFIRPSDVFFFRDARPYDLGESRTRNFYYPPSPTTLAGAFRSSILAKSGIALKDFLEKSPVAKEVQDYIGSPDDPGQFFLKGPFLSMRTTATQKISVYMPLPADAYLVKKPDQGNAFKPVEKPGFTANWPGSSLHPVWPPSGQRQEEPPDSGWLNEENFWDYLSGNRFKILPDPFQAELRTGNWMDYAIRRPRDEMLYSTSFIRLKPETGAEWGLLVGISAGQMPIPKEGWLSLGGEARAARFELVDGFTPQFAQERQSEKIKLVLLTPAWFGGGWQPLGGNWNHILPGAELKSVATRRPLHLGGWDLARNENKTMYACLPPGSVFYFDLQKPVLHKEIQAVIFTESPDNQYFKQFGFGHVAVGGWEWQS
jgi:CRISPR-associated protein Cmr3